MSTKKSIKDQEKELQRREEKIKQQLDSNSDEMKDRLIQVGKIAAISGIVALAGYWVYQTFFADEEDEPEETPKPRVQKSRPNRLGAMLSTMALPYLERILEGVFDDKNEEEESEEK